MTADRLNPQILCSSCRVVSLMSKLVFENSNPSRTAIRRNLNSLSQYLHKFVSPTVNAVHRSNWLLLHLGYQSQGVFQTNIYYIYCSVITVSLSIKIVSELNYGVLSIGKQHFQSKSVSSAFNNGLKQAHTSWYWRDECNKVGNEVQFSYLLVSNVPQKVSLVAARRPMVTESSRLDVPLRISPVCQ